MRAFEVPRELTDGATRRRRALHNPLLDSAAAGALILYVDLSCATHATLHFLNWEASKLVLVHVAPAAAVDFGYMAGELSRTGSKLQGLD